MTKTIEKISGHNEVFLIHDPSDIRKPYSEQLEDLGYVRDLNGKTITGYSSYNVIAIVPNSKSINLLSHCSYSNKSTDFLKVQDIEKLEKNISFDGDDVAKKLYDSGDYFNKKTLTKTEISRVSNELKSSNDSLNITHILDREFDGNDNFNLIKNELGDDFVIRSKLSRTINEKDSDGKSIKLINSTFDSKLTRKAAKIKFKNKTYQDATLVIEWVDFHDNRAVKITVLDRNNKEIFKNSMLLITSKKITSDDDAYEIYLIYLKRSKIEYVFKFLKDGLGWEDMQIKDFKGIQNLLSMCFYISSYLYEIGEESAFDDYAILLAEVGGGKGVVSRHYILEGIKCLLSKYRVERVFKERNIPKKTQEALGRAFGGGD
tara:strand:- start:27 stop:1151 length:1125 start_codon:yes stop_codon:yes gene_type:complete